MLKKIAIQIPIERRTYVKGVFVGKYWAEIDFNKSDQRRENYFDINIYEANVTILETRKFQFGEFEEALNIDVFPTPFPSPTECVFEGKHFKLSIYNPKIVITDEIISDIVRENEKTFGTVRGSIYGYLLHFDYEEKIIEVETDPVLDSNRVIVQGSKTGRFELDGNNRRDEFYNSDFTTYWGDWYALPKPPPPSPGCIPTILGIIPTLISILLGVFFLIAVGWKIALVLIIIGLLIFVFNLLNKLPTPIRKGIGFLGSILKFLVSWWFRIVGALILFAVLFALFKGVSGGYKPNPRKRVVDAKEDVKPALNDVSDESSENENIPTDSIISNFRKWKDYSGRVYQGNLKVKVKDYYRSRSNRLGIMIQPYSEAEMNRIYRNIVTNDFEGLDLICEMFDSIRVKNNIPKGSRKFANVIVSCIQDIPYTLVLNNDCNAFNYDDEFIKKYLSDGGDCLGYTKFGVLAPVEFMARLKGDCDTRTILLYSILSKFGYDVVVLGSYYYKHSILAINIQGDGVYKIFEGRKYFVWETTMEEMQIGQLPPEVGDMRFWNVNLRNINN